jgi:hypothetical protein
VNQSPPQDLSILSAPNSMIIKENKTLIRLREEALVKAKKLEQKVKYLILQNQNLYRQLQQQNQRKHSLSSTLSKPSQELVTNQTLCNIKKEINRPRPLEICQTAPQELCNNTQFMKNVSSVQTSEEAKQDKNQTKYSSENIEGNQDNHQYFNITPNSLLTNEQMVKELETMKFDNKLFQQRLNSFCLSPIDLKSKEKKWKHDDSLDTNSETLFGNYLFSEVSLLGKRKLETCDQEIEPLNKFTKTSFFDVEEVMPLKSETLEKASLGLLDECQNKQKIQTSRFDVDLTCFDEELILL